MFISFKVLLELNEVFPAVEAAERAAKLTPTWSVVWQTLGRTQLGLGEIYMVHDNSGVQYIIFFGFIRVLFVL